MTGLAASLLRVLCLTLALLGAGTAVASAEPRRSVDVGGDRFGYTALPGQIAHDPGAAGGGDPPGVGFRSGLAIVIVTRNGQPVTQADLPAAREAARHVCEATARPFDDSRPARMLRRGGFSFDGACG